MKATRIFIAAIALCVYASGLFAQGGKNFIINHFVSDPSVIESHLVITDVEGQGPSVSMKFYDNEGRQIGEGKELVQPFGKLNLNPGKYVKNQVMNGTIHISSSGGNIVAEYWQFYKKNNEAWQNTTTVGFMAPGFAQLVCPHYVADKDVDAYLVLAASSGQDATAVVKFYDDNGREVGSTRQLVKANGKLILKPTDYVKSQVTGVAHISATGGKITGEYWQAQKSKQYQTAVPMGGL
jgi:hypothetical protein